MIPWDPSPKHWPLAFTSVNISYVGLRYRPCFSPHYSGPKKRFFWWNYQDNVVKYLHTYCNHYDLVHQRLSILKVDDVHIAKVLSFVNACRSCRVSEMFVNYYKIRETGLNLRNRSSLDIPWTGTDLGLSRCDIKGARLWNNYLQTTSQLLYKNNFHKQLSKFFIRKYN